ncbi:MAG: hypothetical protein WAO41_05970 [Candidatus Nanopelagicales bacterium]
MQVWLDVFGVRAKARPRALVYMATQRRPVRRIPGVLFAKLLGTGSGESFTMLDADLGHWALLTVIDDAAVRQTCLQSPQFLRWHEIAVEHAQIGMRPIASHGLWSGRAPFGTARVKPDPNQCVASITRARLRPRMLTKFWRSVPPVVSDLRTDPAVLFTLGIGEAPVGLQGTFSLWRSGRDMSAFAYQRPAHQRAVEQTRENDWYSEELFARFSVESVRGTYRGESIASECR